MSQTERIDAIVQEITINAAMERVFEALTDPRQRVQWWGAEGRFQASHMESDLRPGGKWLMSGTGMENKPFTLRGEYLAVEHPRLIEFTWIADFHENEPPTVVRFDLEVKEGATLVRLTHSGFSSTQSRNSYQGWPWLMSKLQKHVESNAVASK